MKTSLFEVAMLGLILVIAVVAGTATQAPAARDVTAAGNQPAAAVERPDAR